jgi:hypothetical protein
METIIPIVGIVLIAVILFIFYFIAKIMQFVIQAINLYKKIINREDTIIKLLLDIRDYTKNYEIDTQVVDNSSNSSYNEDEFVCGKCNAKVPDSAKICPKCGAEFE